ncbi:hypothetical protein DENSPDRAFT_885080 [Dentipellis sp. KUC8613]|nr:hypothetical protein DENSPDRAFT_885080 [Dentipellis sp. KUC8613]
MPGAIHNVQDDALDLQDGMTAVSDATSDASDGSIDFKRTITLLITDLRSRLSRLEGGLIALQDFFSHIGYDTDEAILELQDDLPRLLPELNPLQPKLSPELKVASAQQVLEEGFADVQQRLLVTQGHVRRLKREAALFRQRMVRFEVALSLFALAACAFGIIWAL